MEEKEREKLEKNLYEAQAFIDLYIGNPEKREYYRAVKHGIENRLKKLEESISESRILQAQHQQRGER